MLRGLNSYSLIPKINGLISDRLTLEVKIEVQEVKTSAQRVKPKELFITTKKAD